MTAIAREEGTGPDRGWGRRIRTHEIGGDITVSFIRCRPDGTWRRCWSDCPTTSASARTGDTCSAGG